MDYRHDHNLLSRGKAIVYHSGQNSSLGSVGSSHCMETPVTVNVNPKVDHDMRIIGRLWSNDDENIKNDDIGLDQAQDVVADAAAEKQNNVDLGNSSDFTVVLSRSKKKKSRKKNAQLLKAELNRTRSSGGPQNFA